MAVSADHLNALLEISKEINSILEQEILFKRILDVALKHLQAERGFILLKPSNSEDLSPVATQNINPDKSSDMSEISRTTVEKVIFGKKAILAFDTQSNQDFDSSKSIILQKISNRPLGCQIPKPDLLLKPS